MAKDYIVLFDLDGTLVDSTPAIYHSFCAAFEAMGQKKPEKSRVVECIGHTLENMFLANGATKDNVNAFITHYRKHYRALMEEGTRLLEGAESAIKEAHSFAHLAVVTTKRGDFSRILLERFNVWKYFDGIVGIESVANPKPDSEPILAAIKQINMPHIEKNHIFMIGDTILDVLAAQNAHINAIAVLCGFGKEQDLAALNVPLCKNTQEAIRFIARNHSI